MIVDTYRWFPDVCITGFAGSASNNHQKHFIFSLGALGNKPNNKCMFKFWTLVKFNIIIKFVSIFYQMINRFVILNLKKQISQIGQITCMHNMYMLFDLQNQIFETIAITTLSTAAWKFSSKL